MYKRIMIVVGERSADQAALKEGLALAKTHESKVLFINVLPRYVVPLPDVPPMVIVDAEEFWQDARRKGQNILNQAHALAMKMGVESQGMLSEGNDDARCIAQAAKRQKCGVVVVGTEGRNAVLRLLSGSVIPGLITHCPVPVLVCKQGEKPVSEARRAIEPTRPRRKRAVDVLSRA